LARTSGPRGEDAACRFLRRQGYRILERNYRGPRYEVDVIAQEGEILAFVEVKTRKEGGEGEAAEAIGPRKRARIARAAEHYLLTHSEARERYCRFDVVLVEAVPGRTPRARLLLRDAFR